MNDKQKQQICKNLPDKYTVDDIKSGTPNKNCICYVAKVEGNICHLYYGKYENGKFYKAQFTTCGNAPEFSLVQSQSPYFVDFQPDAYVVCKN